MHSGSAIATMPGCSRDPVPGDARSERFVVVAPEGLPGAGAVVVAEIEHARAEVGQMKLRRTTGLPQ